MKTKAVWVLPSLLLALALTLGTPAAMADGWYGTGIFSVY